MKNIFNQCSFTEIESCKFYIGIDPTSTKLHIGHFYLFKVSEFLINKGFSMVLLIGVKTAKIGDPTDKGETRKILTDFEVKENVEAILKQLPKLDFEIVYNSSFNHEIELFKNFSVSNLLSNSTFKNRIDSGKGISLLEFIYPVLQGLDFYFLRRDFGVKLQIGGQDQWFNMVTGLNFLSKTFKDSNIATLPLITNKNGSKIGKTENLLQLEANDVWQFFRNIRDENVIPIIQSISEDFNESENINELKIKISDIMTEFMFSKDIAEQCKNSAIKAAKIK